MTKHLTRQLWSPFQSGLNDDFLVTTSGRVTYRHGREGIGRWLTAFDMAGLDVGDRVVIRTDDETVAALGFISALVDGVVPVLLEGTCPDARLSAIVTAVEPGLVLSDSPLPDLGGDVARRLLVPNERPVKRSFFKRHLNTSEFGLNDAISPRLARLPAEDGLAYLMFTSGTTSEPAGVQITRKNITANLDTITRLFGYTSTSRIFNDMVLAHADGMVQGPLLAAWNGCAVLRAGGFEVGQLENWLGQVRQMRATHVLAVPTVWSIIDLYAAHDDYFDAPECTWLMTVADKMSEALMRRLETRFSRPVANLYGLTETVTSALYSGSHYALGEVGTLGCPIDCEARIADGTDEGELQLRGDNVFPGYWRNPERTRQSFTNDGWFRTGDLVRQRQAGNFEMLGRLKTVIMTGGVLIRPDEIDEAMKRHPAVIESATVGLPDEMFGEIAVTGVTLDTEISEVDLTMHLRTQIEPRKVSKRIIALYEIPRGLSGKPTLSELKRLLTEATGTDAGAKTASKYTGASEIAGVILDVAADIFRVPIQTLSPQSHPDLVPGWDSFTHINLIFGVEQRLGIRLSSAQVSKVRRIGDLIDAVEAVR